MLRTFLIRSVVGLAGRLPLGLLQFAGAAAGHLLWYSRSRMALVARENIALCFPDLSAHGQRRLAHHSLVETGKLGAETLFAWGAPVARCRQRIVRVEGIELVEKPDSRPMLIVMPHLGNWEVLNHFLAPRLKLTHMYRPAGSAALDTLISNYRTRTGLELAPANAAGMKQLLQALRRGEAAGVMPDQEPDVHTGTFAPFFGIQCLTGTLVANLATRTGARVILCWCRRLSPGEGFAVQLREIGPTLTPDAMNAAIESAVRSAPQQYLWSYKRFRTRPAGAPELYRFRQHPVRVGIEQVLLSSALWICARLPLSWLQRGGRAAGYLAARLPSRARRTSRRNLELCRPVPDLDALATASLVDSATTLMETAKIWTAEISAFVEETTGECHLRTDDRGTIVLTPPLGNREVVMAYLASRFPVAEYYHPKSRTAVDEAIRRQRTTMGIALAPPCRRGEAVLARRLRDGQLITFCPDQQPRLRGGRFVPFFGVPALTDRTLESLAFETGARVVFAVAWRQPETGRYRLEFLPVLVQQEGQVLEAVNKTLEALIQREPSQYRWSDKRFNIRPAGERKVYQ